MDFSYCEWAPASFLVFSENVFDPLIYYSHLAPLVLSVFFGLFLFLSNWKSIETRALFVITLLVGTWLLSDMVVWATDNPAYTMFFWSLTILLEPVIYAFSLYFLYVFADKSDISFLKKVLIFAPLLPTIALTPTAFALTGFDFTTCDRDAIQGPLVYYGLLLEVIYILWIIILTFERATRGKTKEDRAAVASVGLGTILFLFSFALGNVIGTFFEGLNFLGEDYSWTIGQYGLFGVPIFVAFLAYVIVRFKAFNIRLFGAQALVGALFALVASLLFINELGTLRVVIYVTSAFLVVAGIMLVRSVKREIEQREHIEKLAKDLEKANQQQVTLIHFITHQIKGFVTKSRNIFSMMQEGEFGVVPDSMKPMVQQGFDSDTKGINTIQEILNAANIKSGKVTFTMAPFDLKELIEEIVQDLKPTADAKGLALNLDLGAEPLTITGDRSQLINAFKNLIDNSIRYTPQGSVDVSLVKVGNKVTFKVQDTGVGITAEDMQHLFTEGGHGKESQRINVESTGFGLYIVKNIIEAHKGRVWAESEGAGKGSRFLVELLQS